MKPLALIPLVLLVSGGTAAVTASLLGPGDDAPVAAAEPDATAELVDAVHALEERVAELGRENERLALELAARPERSSRSSAEDLDAAVGRALAARGLAEAPDDAAAPAVATVEGDDAGFDPQAALAELLDPSLNEMQRQEVWSRFAAEGRLDEIVALFEQRAEDEPNNPEAQVDLGAAYLQKVFAAGNGPMAGKWATMADRSFDAALALDERHWEARFSKATSLSFWPPALGKQGEAIQHFELLAQQQEQGPSEPHYAQTYLMLGNTYQQIGDSAKAREAWQRGLSLFPDDGDLAKQVELASAD